MTETSTDIKSIFADALEKATPDERAAYLDVACRGDGNLRLKVESLLEAYAAAVDVPDSLIVSLDIIPYGEDLNEGSGTVVGRYNLLEKIGEGGMAVVYMAEQAEPIRRKVALKIIKLGMDTKQVIARFEAERQALAMMDHPNIAKVFDAGATNTGRPYFVMELVTGVSITEYCDANHLSTKERLALFVQVCNAIQHAHQKGVIHRDIKPSNVLVTMHDGKPVPKVIDFGIAKATDQRLTEKTLFTRYAQIIGTPAYMSPEQAELSDVDIDTRSDIYSLGVLLYELLTGTTPFNERQLREAGYVAMQRVIREEEPLRPSTRITTLGQAAREVAARRGTSVTELTKRLRRELEWIPLMAMRKDRTQRYASASELAHDVENYLGDRPLTAGPESVVYRFRKTVRKHRVPIIAGFIVAAALIGGLAVSTSLYMNLRRVQTVATKLTTQAEVHDKLSMVQRLYGQGRYQEALDEINATLHEYDLHSQAHLLRAQLLMELGRIQEAEENLNELTRAEPEIAGAAHYLLARANVGDDPEKADQHRKLAESILPRTAEAYYLRAMTAASADDAIGWLSKTLELDPQHYAAYRARALANSSVKAYPMMLEDAGAMVVLRPHDYLGYSLRAMARRETGQLEEAVRDHTRALALCAIEEEFPRLYEQRIQTYLQIREYDKVLADAQQQIVLSPDSLNGYFYAFVAHMSQGDYAKARTVYEEFTRQITGSDKRPTWFLEGRLEQYVFELVEKGQPFALPPDIAEQSPFYLMQQSADLHGLLKKSAKPLAVCDGFWPGGGWSLDGRYLAYQRHSSFSWLPGAMGSGDPAMDDPRIEIMDLETGGATQTGGSGYNPAWSPDGQFITYTRYLGSDVENGVWLMSTAGGRPRRLAAGEGAQWARDSKHVFFSKGGMLNSIAIDVPNAKPVLVPEVPPGLISPQGDLIATFELVRGCISEVRVLTFPEGSDVARWRLPWPFRKWCTPLQWHPNGKTLILNTMYYDSPMGMCLFDIDKGKAIHVLNLSRPWCRTMWSPDGSRLLISPFGTAAGTSPWMMEVDTKRPLEEVLAPALSTEEFLRMLRDKWDQRIAADPVYAKHYVCRAIVLLAAGNYEGVEQDLMQCTRLVVDPNDPAVCALRHWGEAYAATNRYQETETLGRVNLALAERYPNQYPDVSDQKHPCQLLMRAYQMQAKTKEIADLRKQRPALFLPSSGVLHGSQGANVSQSHDP